MNLHTVKKVEPRGVSNWLDKTIGYFSPTAGLKRTVARRQMSIAAAYDGARDTRRTSGWLTSGASANVEIVRDLPRLRDRSSDLVRNNHFVSNAQAKWCDALVGPGILNRWEDPELQRKWDNWSRRSSADGLPHFEAIQYLAAAARWERGECFLRLRMRDRSFGVWPPFQVQVLESDYLDLWKTVQTDTGYIIQGVEFDKLGRRLGYWMFGQHPGEALATGSRNGAGLTSSFIPAAEVIHVYKMDRPGQVRGTPRTSSILLRTYDCDTWEDAEIIRKKTESSLAGAVTSPEGEEFSFTPGVLDAAGNSVQEFQPGMLLKLKPGEDFKLHQPNYAGGYSDYKTSINRDQAAGLQTPYELVTGDYSKSNYSSSRMGVVAFGRTVEADQWNVTIPAYESVAQEFLRLVDLFEGRVKNPRHEWQPPKFNLLDRHAEALADMVELQIGTTAWMDAVSRQGLDPVQQLVKIQKYADELKKLGVDYFAGKVAVADIGATAPQQQGGQP